MIASLAEASNVVADTYQIDIRTERHEIAWAAIGLGMMMDHDYMVKRGLDETSTSRR